MARDFATCIRNSTRAQGGSLSEEEADDLIRRYAFHVRSLQAKGAPGVGAAARDAVAAELQAVAAQKRADVVDAIRVRNELLGYAKSYTKPFTDKPDIFGAVVNVLSNIGFGAGRGGLDGLALAKYNLAMGKMGDALTKFYRSRITGGRFNKPLGEDIARELHGESTGSAEAKGFAKILADGIEDFRVAWNEASGRTITPLKNWMPQFHDGAALLRAGFDKWFADIKPRLDLDRMRDPLNDGKLTPERLKETMRVAWEHATTGGWSDKEPSAGPLGLGKLANQRQEHRFIYFKSADDWMAYGRQYGRGGDPIEALLHHFRSMSEDIAAMEVLGRNPPATVEWLVQAVKSEAAKRVAGKPSLYDPDVGLQTLQDRLGGASGGMDEWRIRGLYNAVTGADAPVSKRTAMLAGDIRNLLTSAQLGASAVLAAVQDPWLDRQGRLLSGIPVAAGIPQFLKVFAKGQRDEAVRAGFGFDDFFHIGREARFAGVLGGHDWSRWLADKTVTWSGLEPMTQRRKHQFAFDFAAMAADHTKFSWDELGNANWRFKRTMEDYGLGEKDWKKLQAVTQWKPSPDSAGWLRPVDVAGVDEKLAERYLAMILGQTERAVPSRALRSLAALADLKKGTVAGEVAGSFLQYKGFTLSFMMAQWQAIQMEAATAGPRALITPRGAAYAGSTLIGMTLAGAAAMQLKSIINGKDVQKQDVAFWIAATQYGGGLGLAGDFMLADVNRFGQTPVESFLGPGVGLAKDIVTPTLNFGRTIRGQKTHLDRDLVNELGRYTPVAASLWYTRAAYRRMVIDQLMHLGDPDASAHFRTQESNLFRETGQKFWWRPGEALPSRPPAISEQGSRVK